MALWCLARVQGSAPQGRTHRSGTTASRLLSTANSCLQIEEAERGKFGQHRAPWSGARTARELPPGPTRHTTSQRQACGCHLAHGKRRRYFTANAWLVARELPRAIPSGGPAPGTRDAIRSVGTAPGTPDAIPSGGPAPGTPDAIPSGGPAPGMPDANPSGGPAPGTPDAIPSGGPAPGTPDAIPSGGPAPGMPDAIPSGGPGTPDAITSSAEPRGAGSREGVRPPGCRGIASISISTGPEKDRTSEEAHKRTGRFGWYQDRTPPDLAFPSSPRL